MYVRVYIRRTMSVKFCYFVAGYGKQIFRSALRAASPGAGGQVDRRRCCCPSRLPKVGLTGGRHVLFFLYMKL